MASIIPRITRALDREAGKRFTIAVRRKNLNDSFKQKEAALESKHAAALSKLEARAANVDRGIWKIIEENRSLLIAAGRRSFVTMTARFQFRTVGSRTEILDKQGIMDTARRIGVVRQIADPPKNEWHLNRTKFLAWLDKHGEYHREFEPYLDDIEKHDSLSIKPNTNYTVMLDNKHLTPPSITIDKS
jgi:phage host-nuclease inhibitor protein Gam